MKYGERIRERSPYAAATTQIASTVTSPPLEKRLSDVVSTPYAKKSAQHDRRPHDTQIQSVEEKHA